jgi:serine/threonine protein kinase
VSAAEGSAAVGSTDDLPKLEQYELFEEIGHGGMATVYRARDPRLGREVAVKIIHRHLRDNAEVAARFVAEARAAAKLKHPGIVEVYDVSREEDREKYLVAELLRGCTLRKVLTEHREMPAEIGAAIVVELCEAVEHAHEAGIIHRDIKPENVLVEQPRDRARDTPPPERARSNRSENITPIGSDRAPTPVPANDSEVIEDDISSAPRATRRSSSSPRGSSREPRSGRTNERVVIKLTDFGIAKILDAQGVTSTGQVLGSPAHMAPEQIEGGEVDARTDVFALGVLLYECMVGHLPFEGKNPAQVLRKVIEGNFSPADSERPTVGSKFAEIVARSLATAAADRTPTPSALAEELRKELEALGLIALPDEISAYFADPEAYREALAKRIVPKLIARGETLRKERKVPLAAGDFNRAHALAPNDASILRRITALASARSRSRLVKRVGLLALGALALGSVTYGVVRFSKREIALLDPAPSPTFAADDRTQMPKIVGDTPQAPAETEAPSSPAVPSARVIAVVRPVGTGPTADTPSGPRKVKFAVSPVGAKLEVAGTPVDWTSELSLPLGSHSYALIPPQGETCCDRVDSSFTVSPPSKDKPDEPQKVMLRLKGRPATVVLEGAPSDGTVFCVPFGSLPAGASRDNVALPNDAVEWTGPCTFSSADTNATHTVTIRAGARNPISWPLKG